MTPRPHTRRRQLLETAARSFGAVVAITFVGMIAGALIGTGYGVIDGNIGTTGNDFDPIGVGGLCGAMAGGGVSSGVLAISAYFKGFRRKLVEATEHASGCLHCFAVLGGCSILIGLSLWFSETTVISTLTESLPGNILLLTILSACFGSAAGIALGLVVAVLTVVCLAVVVLFRMSAGFLRSARKGPESVSADLIDGKCDPWSIRAAAALMPADAGRRWRDDFNEARYDYEDDQHTELLLDFLGHVPAVIVWAWIATLQRRALSAARKPRW